MLLAIQVRGVKRLKGQAKSYDVVNILKETPQMHQILEYQATLWALSVIYAHINPCMHARMCAYAATHNILHLVIDVSLPPRLPLGRASANSLVSTTWLD